MALHLGRAGSFLCRTLSHVFTSDCSWSIQLMEVQDPALFLGLLEPPALLQRLACSGLCCHAGLPPQWIHLKVEHKKEPAFAGFIEELKAPKMEPSGAQPPISAPGAENEGMHAPPKLPATSPMLGAAPQGWTPQAVGVRCPPCQCAELVCKLGVPALDSLAQSSCACCTQ